MKKIASFLALAASLLTLSACASPAAAAATPAPTATATVEYKKIPAADAKARMDSGEERGQTERPGAKDGSFSSAEVHGVLAGPIRATL